MGWEKAMDGDLAGPSDTTRQPSFATVHRSRSRRSQWSSTSSPDPTATLSESTLLSCVARETSQDGCSYSRFLAWAACQRNSCRKMSSTEKLSCPLHQCRKQFQDHETMLTHLARCQHLTTREYWCYDHMRVERFDDAKCKRCIGHPSRRRKMVSMAKSLFSTLGHKSKRLPPESHFDVDDTKMPAPPTYDESLSFDPPTKPELPSTEIVEIDSTEVPVPQATVTEAPAPAPAIDPQALLLPELDSMMIPMHSGMQWQPTPYYPPPTNNQYYPAAPAYDSLSFARPASHSPPQGAQQNRQAPRSKNLSPSSSVRSTTSTMSNVSNVSSITTTSSLWSAPSTAWSGLETNMTSLSRDDLFDGISDQCPSDPLYVLSEIPELPADMPVMPELSSGDFAGFQDSLFPFDANLVSADISYPDDFGLEEETAESLSVQPMRAGVAEVAQSEVKSLVALAWEALKEHIISSQHKIKQVHNPLAHQLRLLSAETIAARGLGCLRRVLERNPPVSPLDTLCLVHVVYSLSLVVYGNGFVHGDDATRRSREFFAQSLLYATWFTPEDRSFFRQIAFAIWQPGGLADEELSLLLRQQSVLPQWLSHNKGKEHETRPGTTGDYQTDPLVSAAQDFLDELEISAILSSSSDTLASGLRAKHSEDASIRGNTDDQVTMNGRDLMNVLSILVNRFHDSDGLIARLSQFNERLSSGLPCSTRRFELEALQAGKSCIIPVKYFDDYVPLVRSLCDPIYELDGSPRASRRQEYYSLGIALSEELIAGLNKEGGNIDVDTDAISEDELDDDDLFASLLTPPLTDDLMDVMDMQTLLGLDTDDNAPSQPTLEKPARSSSSAPAKANTEGGSVQSPSDSGASSNHATQTPSSSESPSQQKVEADACCELCGYRPKGDPRWFHGSMAKHKKLQHSTDPPKIYQCLYPGCNSAYKNRPDNLRQHQIEKNHFVEGQDGTSRRPSKRRKVAS